MPASEGNVQPAPEYPPHWFVPAVRGALHTVVNPINQDVQRLFNRLSNDGLDEPFRIVTFDDGTNPTAPPNNLPPLRTANDIETISAAEVSAYLRGYGVQVPQNVIQRRCALARTIGCIATICP